MKKIISSILILVFMFSMFTGCSEKDFQPAQEVLDLMETDNFPTEFLPTAGIEYAYQTPYVTYTLKSVNFEETKTDLLAKAEAMGAVEISSLDTDQAVEFGVFPGFNDVSREMGMDAWLYQGTVDNNTLYITIQEERLNLIKYSYVSVAFEETPDLGQGATNHVHEDDGSVTYLDDEGNPIPEDQLEGVNLVTEDHTAEDDLISSEETVSDAISAETEIISDGTATTEDTTDVIDADATVDTDADK